MAILDPAFRIERKARSRPKVELTALLDVILLLLLFVLLTSEFVLTSSFNVELHRTSEATSSAAEALLIRIPRSSQAPLYLNGDEIPWEEVPARLREARANHPESVLLLAPDRKTDGGRILRTLEAAQAAGFSRVRIAVEQREDSE